MILTADNLIFTGNPTTGTYVHNLIKGWSNPVKDYTTKHNYFALMELFHAFFRY